MSSKSDPEAVQLARGLELLSRDLAEEVRAIERGRVRIPQRVRIPNSNQRLALIAAADRVSVPAGEILKRALASGWLSGEIDRFAALPPRKFFYAAVNGCRVGTPAVRIPALAPRYAEDVPRFGVVEATRRALLAFKDRILNAPTPTPELRIRAAIATLGDDAKPQTIICRARVAKSRGYGILRAMGYPGLGARRTRLVPKSRARD